MKKIYTKLKVSFIFILLVTVCLKGYSQNIKPLIANQDQIVYNGSSPLNYIDDSAQKSFAVLNGIYYFIANADDAHAGYLWRSDGTAAGTFVVTNKISGATNVDTINGTLYIASKLGDFVSTGTDAGTHKISGTLSGGGSSNFVNFQGHVFYGDVHILYKTDGTQGGTVEVNQFGVSGRFRFLPLKNILLFTIFHGEVAQLNFNFDGVGAEPSVLGYQPNSTLLGDSVYYSGNGSLYTYPQDIADATSLGTQVANPANAVIGTSYVTTPFCVLNGVIYFAATTAATGTELYKYDPSAGAGITLVKDIIPGAGGAGVDNKNMLVIGSTLYFTATGGDGSSQLWKTDGTEAGTLLVKVVEAGTPTTFSDFTNVNGSLFFGLHSIANGAELWSSDGTDAGTVLVKQIHAGEWRSSLGYITSAGGSSILFAANDGPNTHGSELWVSDGTGAGTSLLKDINTTTVHSPRVLFNNLTKVGDYIIFNGTDTAHGSELWATNGTTAGTGLIKDILPGTTGSNPQSFQVVNGTTAYFIADSAGKMRQLWKTDGTAAGTVLVKDFDSLSMRPAALVGIFKNFVFLLMEGSTPAELWRSDGTDTGTHSIMQLQYYDGSQPFKFAAGTGSIFFSDANHYISTVGDKDGHDAWHIDIYASDGTAGGTTLVHRFTATEGFPSPEGDLFATAGDVLALSIDNSLYVIDNSGFRFVTGYLSPTGRAINGRVYAFLFSSAPNYYLGKVDPSGNVSAVYPAITGSNLIFQGAAVLGGKIYYRKGDRIGVLDEQDSTLTDILQGTSIGEIAKGYGKLYFTAELGTRSETLGVSDGTDAGSSIITDTILPFAYIETLMAANHHLIFSASIQSNPLQYQLYGLQVSDALPVKLSAFTGKLINGNGVLNWSTAGELNSSYFGIERSTDGMQFNSIGTVRAAGNASFTNNYTYTDYNVVKLGAPNLYYRLKPVDKDGKFTYSNTVLLHPYLDFTASVSPVPVADRLTVSITSAKTQTVQLIVTDVNGKVLLTGKKAIGIGSTTLQYNTGGWAAGIYLVQLTQADGTKQTIKIVKQ